MRAKTINIRTTNGVKLNNVREDGALVGTSEAEGDTLSTICSVFMIMNCFGGGSHRSSEVRHGVHGGYFFSINDC